MDRSEGAAMADPHTVSADALVRKVLTDEHADLVREAVSFLCHQIMEAEGSAPYLWLDAKVEKVRDVDGRVRRKSLVVAYAVHEAGYREVIALDVGASESGPFWREFLRGLVARGLRGVELVVSDAHEGLKNAVAQVLGCPWQRCTVHVLREMTGYVHRGQQGMVAAALRQVFQADSGEDARRVCREVIGRLEPV